MSGERYVLSILNRRRARGSLVQHAGYNQKWSKKGWINVMYVCSREGNERRAVDLNQRLLLDSINTGNGGINAPHKGLCCFFTALSLATR